LVPGLLATHTHTAPKCLYDVLSSRLFAAIYELPEYYPTRTEAAILQKHASHIATAVGRDAILIDLGVAIVQRRHVCFQPCNRGDMCRLTFSNNF